MNFIKKHWYIITLLLIFAAGVFVRVYDFGNTPYGLNQDEASLGYDAWADITYGMDRNGDHNPIYAEAWNSGQNMLYNYLIRPLIARFGLSAFVIRFPMMLSGIITLLLFYLFMRELFSKHTALLGVFMLAICPWHIMLSRWAIESNFVIMLAVLAMLFFAKAWKKEIWFIPAMLVASLFMYAYSVTLVFLTIFIPSIVIYVFVKKIVSLKYILLGIGVFLVVSIPMVIFLIVNKLELETCKFLCFTIPNFAWLRYATEMFKEGNGLLEVLSDNIWRTKDIFIKMEDGRISNATRYGAIYKFLIPFIIIGILRIINLVRDKKEYIVIPALWMFAAILHIFLIDINITRINISLIPFIIAITLGLEYLFKRVRGLSYITITVCILAFLSFTGYYFNNYNKDAQNMFYGGFDDAVRCADEYTEHSGGVVYLSSCVHESYVMAAYAIQMPPELFEDNRGTRFVQGIPKDIMPQSGDAFIIKYDESVPEYLDPSRCYVCGSDTYTVYMIP